MKRYVQNDFLPNFKYMLHYCRLTMNLYKKTLKNKILGENGKK